MLICVHLWPVLDSLRAVSVFGMLAVCSRVAVAAFVVVGLASSSDASSLATIRSRADGLGGEVRAAAGDARAEKALIEPLGELVLAYVDESDRLQRAGDEDRRKDELRSAFEAVHTPLKAIYSRHGERLEKMSRAVMEADGDLEALYETAEFQEAQATAANALYYLNWLDYYGARAFDGARRTELLRACEEGFSQFAVGDHAEELVNESLLGRGLCYLELDNYTWARRDFETVIGSNASPERRSKARLALLDSYFRGGESTRTISYARQLLSEKRVNADEVPLVRFYELQALLAAADRSDGARAQQYRREAGAVTSQLRRAGGAWGAKVDALLASTIKDPSQWAGKADTPAAQWQLAQLFLEKEDCDGAQPLLETLLASDAAEAARHHLDARYWIAVCHFRARRYESAAADLGAVLEVAGEASYANEARYLRFKALEAMMASDDPPAEVAGDYVDALRDLLAHDSDQAKKDEARYRLGEYLQTTGDFAAAIEQYEQVSEDEAFRLRAAFGTLQSRFELLRAEVDPSRREETLSAIGSDLAHYDERAAAYAKSGAEENLPIDLPIDELDAKVTLLRAVHAGLATDRGDELTAEILADYAADHAEHEELVAQASRMRLGALLRLNRHSDAERELAAHAAALRAEARAEALTALASSFARQGRMSESPDDAAAAARLAVALYALADEAGAGEPSLRQKVSIAQLQEKAGELDAAAAGYREVLAENPNTLAALRGLARIAEERGEPKAALAHWVTYTEKVRAGDTGWFRGQYEQARLQLASGDGAAACERLSALRTALPGLKDDEIRAALKALYEEAGC